MAIRVLAFCVGMIFSTQCFAGSNLEPMFGSVPLTEEQQRLNDEFVETILASGMTREKGAKLGVEKAFALMREKDFETSMKRFNQAWLLDAENGNVYYGFALLSAYASKPDDVVEKFFKTSFSKNGTSTTAFSDYGWFLIKTDRFDEARTVLEEHHEAFNARSHLAFLSYLQNDFAGACKWATAAEEIGHELEPGFKDAMCGEVTG